MPSSPSFWRRKRGPASAPAATFDESSGAAPVAERASLGAGEREPRGAQRRPRVVGHLARPDEVPEGLLQLGGLDLAEVDEQVRPERGAGREPRADRVVGDAGGRLAAVRRRAQPAHVVAEVEGDSA